jgi:hypothetical protein
MRNAVYRRQHRERGQLEGREKWGILEKHKVGSIFRKEKKEERGKKDTELTYPHQCIGLLPASQGLQFEKGQTAASARKGSRPQSG